MQRLGITTSYYFSYHTVSTMRDPFYVELRNSTDESMERI